MRGYLCPPPLIGSVNREIVFICILYTVLQLGLHSEFALGFGVQSEDLVRESLVVSNNNAFGSSRVHGQYLYHD